jgi:drug/metabolite transporter (DMT)-like permease
VSLLALALVLGAALMHAAWNALAKKGGDPLIFLWWAGMLASGLYLPVTAAAIWRTGLPAEAVPFVVATSVLHALYFWSLGRAYAAGDYSIVYPVARGLGVALVPPLALAAFDERVAGLGLLGALLVVSGISWLSWRPGAWRLDHLLRPGTGWAVVTGCLIATYSVVDKAGVARLHPLPYMGFLMSGATLCLAPAVRARRKRLLPEWRANRRAILVAGFMIPTSYLLVLFAFQLSKAAYVVAAREVSVALSALIGCLLLREGETARRLLGAAVVLAGVACVALAR